MTVEDADTPELDALAETARRRQRRLYMIILGSTVIIGPVIGVLVAVLLGHRHTERHHTSTVGAVIALTVGVLLLAGEIGFVYWLAKAGKGFFKASLALGLPLRDRRRVLKAVRRGVPPPEPTLRAVGLRMAERTVRYRNPMTVMYGLIALAQALNALVPDRPGWLRWLFAVAAVLFLCVLAYQRAVTAGARRYLEQARRYERS